MINHIVRSHAGVDFKTVEYFSSSSAIFPKDKCLVLLTTSSYEVASGCEHFSSQICPILVLIEFHSPYKCFAKSNLLNQDLPVKVS